MIPDKNYIPDQLEELQEAVVRLKSENLRLEKLAEQADAANKAKSDFLAMISHEIRTPMNGVIGLTELMLGMEQDSKQKKYTGLILTSARNLLTLINSLLDFSKIEADMMELDITEFNLRKLVEELMTLYNVATLRKDVQVFSEIDPDVPAFFIGDSYRIRQIFVNLLGNAIKFTDVGSVVLKVIYTQHSDDDIKLLRFEVRDSGPGIPPDKLDRLFKPFTQVDASSTRRYGGTGLGLSICQKLVELMKGEIGVNSEKGTGSTFWFALPLKPGAGKSYDSQPVLDKEVEIPVVDEEGGILPANQEGDIAVRVKPERPVGLMKEYWKEPDRTASTFKNGWYLTGDRAYVDEDGYFWFVGRSDDVILTSGYRIGPFEVESALIEHPAVAESAVVSSPDDTRGEVVKAFVILAPGFKGSDDLVTELKDYVKKVTAPYKYPRKIEFVEALPKTISGKIRRIELRNNEWGR